MPGEKPDHWSRTAAYFAAFVAIGMVTALLGPALPSLAAHVGAELDAISSLFTAGALGYLIGSFLGGRLYDRVAGHPVMVAALGLQILLLLLVPTTSLLWLLAAAWFLVGMAGGAIDVGGNTLMVWLHGRGVGPYMNGLHFFWGVGSFLAAIIVAQALSITGDVNWAFWAAALLLVPVAAWLVRQPSPAPATNRHQTAEDTTSTALSSRAAWFVALVALLLLFYVGSEAAFGGWIYTYALAMSQGGAAAITGAAYLTSAFGAALTVGRLLGIPIAARFRPGAILVADLLGCVASLAIILAWPDSVVALWAGSIGLGLAQASIFPAAITLTEQRVHVTGQITGWFLVGASIGAMTLPWLIGQLFEPVGPQVAMIAILAATLAALAVTAVLVLAWRD